VHAAMGFVGFLFFSKAIGATSYRLQTFLTAPHEQFQTLFATVSNQSLYRHDSQLRVLRLEIVMSNNVIVKDAGVMMQPPRKSDAGVNVLGLNLSIVGLHGAVETIERWIEQRQKRYVCVADSHCAIESRTNSQFRAVYRNAGLVTADGMPLVWMCRLFGERRLERIRGTDLMRELSRVSQLKGYRQFYFGGREQVLKTLQENLVRANPALQVAGAFSPPFRSLSREEDDAIIKRINDAQPDIVWVGLGAPKQELWMAEHLDRIQAPVMIGVGAAFDFLAEAKREAPVWMQQSGLEWLFRLCSEPRRLWRRYARVVPTFIVLATAALIWHGIEAAKDRAKLRIIRWQSFL